ncbi:MAG: CBS domain-containing protein [Archaeoglobaceae archaeon]
MDIEVSEIMSRKIEIDPNETVLDAVEKMISRRIRSVLVKPESEEDEYGVVTMRDVVFKCLAKNLDLKSVKVREIATKPLITVEKNTKLSEVIKKLEENNIERIFVRDGKKIVGVVSLIDILTYFLTRKNL